MCHPEQPVRSPEARVFLEPFRNRLQPESEGERGESEGSEMPHGEQTVLSGFLLITTHSEK